MEDQRSTVAVKTLSKLNLKVIITMKKLLFFILLTIPTFGYANEIVIEITNLISEKIGEKHICRDEHTITNNSTGTIYNLQVDKKGWDDRGEDVNAGRNGFFLGGEQNGAADTPYLPKGKSVKLVSSLFYYETQCSYLRKIEVVRILDALCNIRNFPENLKCSDIIKVKSKLEQLEIINLSQ